MLEYNGASYAGWQIQPNAQTVQSTLESALKRFLGMKTKTIAAGRTDAGVHALGQVANFTTNKELDTVTIKNALNAYLPNDIFIKHAGDVDVSFNARFDAVSRLYVYRIAKKYSVFTRPYTWHYTHPLDVQRMNEGCSLLVGENDCTSFSIAKSRKENMVINIFRCHFTETENEIEFKIKADRFLHKSVRTMVGTLLLLGRKKLEVYDIKKIIASRDISQAGSTAPAHGLFLKEVNY
jgi:tRNA pseudouridine38-40 synthase